MKVDLPEPEGPTRKTNSPLSMESDDVVEARSRRCVYALVTPSKMTIGPSPGRSTERRSARAQRSRRARRARSRARAAACRASEGVEGASVLMVATERAARREARRLGRSAVRTSLRRMRPSREAQGGYPLASRACQTAKVAGNGAIGARSVRRGAGQSSPTGSGAGSATRRIAARAALQLGPDEPVQVAVEHALRVARLVPGTKVLDHRVRVHDVGADLAAEADRSGSRRGSRPPRPRGAPARVCTRRGAQQRHRGRAVLGLRALVLALDDDLAWAGG